MRKDEGTNEEEKARDSILEEDCVPTPEEEEEKKKPSPMDNRTEKMDIDKVVGVVEPQEQGMEPAIPKGWKEEDGNIPEGWKPGTTEVKLALVDGVRNPTKKEGKRYQGEFLEDGKIRMT